MGFVVVHGLAVGREGRTVGANVVVVDLVDGHVRIDAVKRGGAVLESQVHGAGPQPALGIDLGVIEAIAGLVALDVEQRRQLERRKRQRTDRAQDGADEAARLALDDPRDHAGHVPALPRVVGEVKPKEFLATNVEPVECLVARRPDRAFAQDHAGARDGARGFVGERRQGEGGGACGERGAAGQV